MIDNGPTRESLSVDRALGVRPYCHCCSGGHVRGRRGKYSHTKAKSHDRNHHNLRSKPKSKDHNHGSVRTTQYESYEDPDEEFMRLYVYPYMDDDE